MDLRPDLRLALELADAADTVTRGRFRAADLRVEAKPDATPVTEADRAAERAIRDRLARDRPDDGILGEEFEGRPGDGRRWILDPIDGTLNFVRGIPVWGTLIALEIEGKIAVGVVSAPAIGHRWWAARGLGAWRNAARIRVSEVRGLADAHLSYNSQVTFEQAGLGGRGLALSRRCRRTRGYGDFWSHMLVAEGAIDVSVEPIAAIWDLAPLGVIVEEAGGRFTDLAGARRIDGGNALASNGLLHEEALEVFTADLPDGDRPATGPVVP